ncbi:MAG: GGDEF domain-containing protein [Pseudomonadota bacterium]
MTAALNRALFAVVVPATAILGAFLLVRYGGQLPPAVAALRNYGAYAMLAVTALTSLGFNRSRPFFVALTLAAAYLGYKLIIVPDLGSVAARTVYLGICLLVPINLALLAWLPERGIFNVWSLRRLVLILGEVALVAALARAQDLYLLNLLEQRLFALALPGSPPIPQLGVLTAAGSFLAIAVRLVGRGSPNEAGLAGALAAFTCFAYTLAHPAAASAFAAAAALILFASLLQDSYRMAFRDELTGLPNRRALNERLMSLSGHYAVAMVDVDHFKRFNDAHGHDVGDQVLRMVAARLAEVGGGGRPYRFGGEEFAVLFPGVTLREALPHLEALRARIAGYKLAVRGKERPASERSGRRERGRRAPDTHVSVTVSVGVAEPNERYTSPEEVLRAADKALYRAKRRGRNQVSR